MYFSFAGPLFSNFDCMHFLNQAGDIFYMHVRPDKIYAYICPSSRGPLHYIFRRCSKPRQIVWCYTNDRYKPYLSHWKVRLLTALLNCQNCQFWQFDRDKRSVGLVCIIYRVLYVYVGVGLARWMCRHTFELVRGRRRLKRTRAGGSLDSQLPIR
jgi:hypothetical protein